MELYHLHLLGHYDRLYKENKEFVIDRDKFNNRIYNRIYNMNSTTSVSRYPKSVGYLNYLCRLNNMYPFDDKINPGEILEMALKQGIDQDELIKVLQDVKDMILAEGINLREMAMEEYRKENCKDIPSRMHSLFACSEEGLDFWIQHIMDNDVDIFRIEVFDEVFLSNEGLLPEEKLSYGDKIKASYNYFHPRKKDLNPLNDEYLVQGKVRIIKKEGEVRRK